MQDRIKIREKGRDSGSKRETSGSGAICIQGRDGRIRESFVVSRGDFEKISAIEGLVMSAEMKRDFARPVRRRAPEGDPAEIREAGL